MKDCTSTFLKKNELIEHSPKHNNKFGYSILTHNSILLLTNASEKFKFSGLVELDSYEEGE